MEALYKYSAEVDINTYREKRKLTHKEKLILLISSLILGSFFVSGLFIVLLLLLK